MKFFQNSLTKAKCSENGTTVTRAAVTRSNPREHAVELNGQENMPEKLTSKCSKKTKRVHVQGNEQARRLPEKPTDRCSENGRIY